MSIDLTPIDHFVVQHKPIGSRVICNPPPTDTDEDHLILIESEDLKSALDVLESDGWKECPYYANPIEGGCNFVSFRNGALNLLVTTKDRFFCRFVAATSVAKRFNLMNKDDRIALFQAVLYGNPCGVV